MKKKYLILPFVLLLMLASYAGCGAVRDKKVPAFKEKTELYVWPATTSDEVLEMLKPNAKWPRRLKKLFREENVEGRMKPGHYEVPVSAPAIYVPRMLKNGWQTPVRVTLAGTLRDRGEIARRIAVQMMVDSAAVRNAFENDSLLAAFGLTPEKVFVGMIPDTYEMWWTDSPEVLFHKMASTINNFWTSDNLGRALAVGLSPEQVMVLASIVTSETNNIAEMPKIAGVYLNRLKKGMRLQADPTIAFCYDFKADRILKKMLEVDSPYNTYRRPGLPPAPICIPSRAAILSVLYPDFGPGNLYFCADPSRNGTHRFAKSYQEHLRNAAEFQRALDAEKSRNAKN